MNLNLALKSIILAAALGVYPFAAGAAQVSADDLKAVEAKVRQQSLEHKRLQEQASQINIELTNVNKEMIKAARQIQNNEDKLSQMENQLNSLEKDLEDAQLQFGKEDEHLIKTLAALQNLALRPTESLLVQPLSPVQIIRSAMLLRETVPFLENRADFIKQKLADIAAKKSRVERQITEISKQKKILQSEHSKMKTLYDKKSKLRASVESKSEQAQKNMTKLASQAQDLRDLLAKIEKQRKEKAAKLAEEQRKRKLEEKQSADLIKEQTPSITNIVSGFGRAKGSLPLPARGQVIGHYGDQKNNGISSKGITIATRANAQVISPFDGTVIFAGPFRGYGDMIIIEHGDGYLSLMSGLGRIEVELGQMLLAGEPIGQMSKDSAELYVEVRKDNQPINPAAWFKI